MAVNFVLVPLITSSVSSTEYGGFIAYQTICSILNVFVGFSSAAYISNAFIDPDAGPEISSALLLASLLTLPAILLFAYVLNRNLQNYSMAIVLAMVVTGLLTYIVSYFQAYLILSRRYGDLLAVAMIQTLPQAGLITYCVLDGSLDLGKLVAGGVLGLLTAAAYCWHGLRARLGWHFVAPGKATVRKVILYGLPLIPHLLLSLAVGSFDRWFLTQMLNIELLAVYAVALAVSAPMYALLDVANKVYAPLVFDRLRNGDATIARFRWPFICLNAYSMVCASACALAGSLYVRFFFKEEYIKASQYCVPLCYSIGLFALYYSAAPFLYYFNNTRLVLLTSVVGACVTGAATLLLYPEMAGFGLVLGKSLGFLASGVAAIGLAYHVVVWRKVVN